MFNRCIALLLCLCVFTPVVAKTVRISDKLVVGMYQTEKLTGKAIIFLHTDALLEVVKELKEVTLVKTTKGKTGWVKNTYLTEKKSNKAQLFQLDIKYKALQEKLKKKEKEIKSLKKEVSKLNKPIDKKELSSLRSELKKSREEIAKLKSGKSGKAGKSTVIETEKSAQLLQTIQTLEKNLADEKEKNNAQIAFEKPSGITPFGAPSKPTAEMVTLQQENVQLRDKMQRIANIVAVQGSPSFMEDISVQNIIWVLIALSVLLLLGFFGGIRWLDARQRRRHGGFRVY